MFLTAAILLVFLCVIAAGCVFAGYRESSATDSTDPDIPETTSPATEPMSPISYTFTYEEIGVGMPDNNNSGEWVPVIIRSPADLIAYCKEYKDILGLSSDFDAQAAFYDGDYFKNHTLILALGRPQSSSQSYRVQCVEQDASGTVAVEIRDMLRGYDSDTGLVMMTDDFVCRLFFITVDAVLDRDTPCELLFTSRATACTSPVAYDTVLVRPISAWGENVQLFHTQLHPIFRSVTQMNEWLSKYYPDSSRIPEIFNTYDGSFFSQKTLAAVFLQDSRNGYDYTVISVCGNEYGDIRIRLLRDDTQPGNSHDEIQLILIELEGIVSETADLFLSITN